MRDERHPRFNSFGTSEGRAKQKGRKRMRGSDASEAQCAQSAHVAMHSRRRLLCCHESLSIRILMDINSATILFFLYTRVIIIFYNYILYTCVVHDTTVSRIKTRLEFIHV